MKISLAIKILAAIAVGSTILTISPSAQASTDKYYCRKVNGTYGVFSRTERGSLSLLNFKRDVPEAWTVAKETYINGNTYYDLEVLEQLILQQKSSDRLIKNE